MIVFNLKVSFEIGVEGIQRGQLVKTRFVFRLVRARDSIFD